MFDFAWPELALIGVVGLLFIGPKDMPVAIRTITNLLKKGRKLAGEFQTHVDDMVREADLGEARNQLRQLRSFNVRGQIMKAMDEDGSLKRTLDEKPLADAAPRYAPAPQTVAVGTGAGTGASVGSPFAERLVPERPVMSGNHGWHNAKATAANGIAPDSSGEQIDEAALAASDPGPPILPPRVAGRLRVERARAGPPAFVPPRPRHANAAVWSGGTRPGTASGPG